MTVTETAPGSTHIADGVALARGSRLRRSGFLPLAPALVWLSIFLLTPLGIMFLYSVWRTDQSTYTVVRDFNTDAYKTVFTSGVYIDVIVKSLTIGLLVFAFSLLLGFPTAYLLATRRSSRAKMVLLLLMLVPFWTSVLLRSYAWILVLQEDGAVNGILQATGLRDAPIDGLLFSRFAVVLSLVQLYLPFMVIAIYAVLERFDWNLLEAAKDLGAGKVKGFLTITLPAALPGILIGFLLVFIPSVGAYVTPTLLGGTDGLMASGLIAAQFGTAFNWPLGAAISFVLVAILLALVLALMRLVRPWEVFERGVTH